MIASQPRMIGKLALTSAKRALGSQLAPAVMRTSSVLNDRHFANASLAASPLRATNSLPETDPLNQLRGDVQIVSLPNQDLHHHHRQSACNSDLAGVVVSWPQGSDTDTNDAKLAKNPFRSASEDCYMTSKPFFMLDGKGKRLGSLCLLKASSQADQQGERPSRPTSTRSQLMTSLFEHNDALRLEDCLPSASQSELQMKGIWLQEYSQLKAAQKQQL
jgi:hypothetical protein